MEDPDDDSDQSTRMRESGEKGYDIDSDGNWAPWSEDDSRWSDSLSGSPPQSTEERNRTTADIPWMTAAQAWAHLESGPVLSQIREQHEARRARGQGERTHNSLGHWEIDADTEPNQEMLEDYLTVPGVVRIVTYTDKAYPGFTPTYESINEKWYRSVYVVIAGFQSDSFLDGTSASGPVGPVTLALHGLEGYENPYAEALDALTGSEAYGKTLPSITLEELIHLPEPDLGEGTTTDETLRQQWLETVELEYTHSRSPEKNCFRGELTPVEQVVQRIMLTIWLRTCSLEQSVASLAKMDATVRITIQSQGGMTAAQFSEREADDVNEVQIYFCDLYAQAQEEISKGYHTEFPTRPFGSPNHPAEDGPDPNVRFPYLGRQATPAPSYAE
jgi:hypothetical protein